MNLEIKQYLDELQQAMVKHQLWETTPPPAEALESDQPFCVESLSPTQWLQWVFIPRMHALIEAGAELPKNFAITPYLEEALKEERYTIDLYGPLRCLEQILKD